MCVQHKWPSANINNRRGKYTVRDDARFPSPPPPRSTRAGRGWGLRGARCGDGCGRRAAARRGVMEPLSLDNFIGIGIGVQRRGERAQSSDPEGEGDGGSGGGSPAMGTTTLREWLDSSESTNARRTTSVSFSRKMRSQVPDLREKMTLPSSARARARRPERRSRKRFVNLFGNGRSLTDISAGRWVLETGGTGEESEEEDGGVRARGGR